VAEITLFAVAKAVLVPAAGAALAKPRAVRWCRVALHHGLHGLAILSFAGDLEGDDAAGWPSDSSR